VLIEGIVDFGTAANAHVAEDRAAQYVLRGARSDRVQA
jgi:hypothetical protein